MRMPRHLARCGIQEARDGCRGRNGRWSGAEIALGVGLCLCPGGHAATGPKGPKGPKGVPAMPAVVPAADSFPSGSPQAWVDAAGENQKRILADEDRLPVRYRVHKVDAKGDIVREVIETREGNVARLIGRNAAPLSAEENKAERGRLEGILASPDQFLSHEQRDRASRRFALELIGDMPRAMLWSYAPGQPQPPHARGTQVVLDFTPDPAFKPSTLVTEGLTGIAGRIWIDAGSRCLTRIEGKILHPVNIGWGGVLARVNGGGTMAFEQESIGGGRWLYARLVEHIVIREVLVRTVHEDAELNIFDVQHMPTLPTYEEAIRTLLAIPVPTRD